MCGIVALFAYGAEAPAPERDEVLRIRDAMTARGPDGSGLWQSADGRVALGHRRLAILDTSDRGAQPMLDETGRLAITFNGEIYNFRELRADLTKKGHVFRTESDTEVLLALWKEHGPAMLPLLRGMYAFALWDGAVRRLFLARDPLGIKPLYVCDDGRTLRAASQVKALLAGGAVDTRPEPAGHAGYFLWGTVPEPFTLYRGVRAVPAGGTLSVAEGSTPVHSRRRLVTELLAQGEAAPARNVPAEELQQAVREALLDSVRHHLVADVPVGVFLSAGLDSRTVACLAAESGATVRCATLGFREFEGTFRDEVPLAATLARSLGQPHEARRISRRDFEEDLPHFLSAMDQPTLDGVNSWFVSRAAASVGLKVALSGLGGDELFGGYPSFTEVPRIAGLLSGVSKLPGLGRGFRLATAGAFRSFSSPKWASLVELGGTFEGAYLLRRGLFLPWELPDVMDPEVARRGLEDLAPIASLEASLDGLRTDRARVSVLEMAWYMRNQLLRDADWAGMAHSLEIRVPLVDDRLLAALARFIGSTSPPGKLDMAAACGPVPQEVLSRGKVGFLTPVQEWIRAEGSALPERGLRGWSRMVYDSFRVVDPPGVSRPSAAASIRSVETTESDRAGPDSRNSGSHARARGTTGTRVLVSTLPMWGGGVSIMARFAVATLREGGYTPVLAYYVPFSYDPTLSVPAHHALRRRATAREVVLDGGVEAFEIGATGTELEVNHYRLSDHWRRALDSASRHIAVSGNCFAARPLADAGVPFAMWVATPWRDDRIERERSFPPHRRALDLVANRPLAAALERQILEKGSLLALSQYTRSRLEEIAGRSLRSRILPMPIDTDRFTPDPSRVRPGLVAFVGRLDDPRKRVDLFLEAIRICRRKGLPVTGLLVGGRLAAPASDLLNESDFAGAVRILPAVANDRLPEILREVDVFVLPSQQEGLCIAALEAMACGCPVVSTRCGGPEEFVLEGETGKLARLDASQLAEGIEAIVTDRSLRECLSGGARSLVERRYTLPVAREIFWTAFGQTFGVN